MSKIKVILEDYEYAELVANRICDMWLKGDTSEYSQLYAIIEHSIDGLDEVPAVMDYADNFWINNTNCQLNEKAVIDWLITEEKIDIDELVAFLRNGDETIDEILQTALKDNEDKAKALLYLFENAYQDTVIKAVSLIQDYLYEIDSEYYILSDEDANVCGYKWAY